MQRIVHLKQRISSAKSASHLFCPTVEHFELTRAHRSSAPTGHWSSAPTGRRSSAPTGLNVIAQGNALGHKNPITYQALKGRNAPAYAIPNHHRNAPSIASFAPTARRSSAPTGLNVKAQGNALGQQEPEKKPSPERAQRPAYAIPKHHRNAPSTPSFRPFRAGDSYLIPYPGRCPRLSPFTPLGFHAIPTPA
jgi:hypothetical protein